MERKGKAEEQKHSLTVREWFRKNPLAGAKAVLYIMFQLLAGTALGGVIL